MRRAILLGILLAGCSDLGNVDVSWTITHNGQPSSCAEVGAARVDWIYFTGDNLESAVDCADGMFEDDFDSGDSTIQLTLQRADFSTLDTQQAPFHVSRGETTDVAVVFDVTP